MAESVAELTGPVNDDEHTAFRNLFEESYAPMVHIASAMVGRENAEDIVITVFEKLWVTRNNFKDDNVKGYLFISVRNACFNLLNAKERTRNFGKGYSLFVSTSVESREEQMIRNDVLKVIYEEIERLLPTRRLIFKLKFIEGLNTREIALMIGRSTHNVRNQIYLAKQQLKTRLLRSISSY
jgi:RNA polymerase sigma factor (sigma-70 family)